MVIILVIRMSPEGQECLVLHLTTDDILVHILVGI